MAKFESFSAFYPYYLQEHSNRICRRLHFIGTSLVLVIVVASLVSGDLRWLWLALLAGYGFAWIGHFFFERNRPATFKHPFYSLAGDFRMFAEVLRGKVRI